MAIVTLTTDLGIQDHYVGVVKGCLLKLCPDLTIIDISHHITQYNILEAAYALRSAYKDFPVGTIHIIGVSPEVHEDTNHLVVEHEGQYFIGTDNGVFSLILDEKPEKIFELSIQADIDSLTFPTKDIFAKAACHIAKGGTLEMIGRPVEEMVEKAMFQAVSVGNTIKGIVIHVDHYGNLITNVEESFFKAFANGRDFNIEFRQGDYNISEISKSYSDVSTGEKLALFSSSGLLEISMNQGNASKLLGLNYLDTVRIEFYDR